MSGRIFNPGGTRLNYILTQIAEEIGRIFPGTRVQHISNPDRRNYRVSFTQARRVLNFGSTMSLEDGIHERKAAFSEGRIADYTDPRYHNQRFPAGTGQLTSHNEVDTEVMAAFVWPKYRVRVAADSHPLASTAKS